MKALVTRLTGKETPKREKVLVHDWEDAPPPEGNEVQTRTLFSGVTNGTERNDLTEGNYATPDEALPKGWGYQNVGEVIATGPDVKNLKLGDILYSSCDHKEFVNFKEDGLLAKLPEQVNQAEAALFGMASVAAYTCRNAGIAAGQRVLVIGAGFIGQVVTQIAMLHGGEVDLCDIDSHRLKLAEDIGAVSATINNSEGSWEELIQKSHYDVVIDVAGVVGMEDNALSAAKKGGTVLFIAGRFRVDYDFGSGQHHEITIKQNSHFKRQDLEYVCRLSARGHLKIKPLIQDIVSLTEADRIYALLRDQPTRIFGTVFDWRNH